MGSYSLRDDCCHAKDLETSKGKLYQGDHIPEKVIQYRYDEEGPWKMVNVYRLHQFEQGMS
ncbi:hypothetical protein MTR_2g086465 [Medicago truncatula]|uniref:Uncharacterized protein n=1 Tax=Medicago truncatula TaxID=3880 RepID=A0A072VB29_MEDTR|nr:hypothetical protein MTR_2g086465 [Medicago truncatula]